LQESDFAFVHQVLCFTRVREVSTGARAASLGSTKLGDLVILARYGPVFLTKEEHRARMPCQQADVGDVAGPGSALRVSGQSCTDLAALVNPRHATMAGQGVLSAGRDSNSVRSSIPRPGLRDDLLRVILAGTPGYIGELTDETSLIRSGLVDSSRLLDMVLFVEQEVGRPIDFTALQLDEELDTIPAILRFIETHRGG
jgi:acyl carrier protein